MIENALPSPSNSAGSLFKEVTPWELPVNGEQLLDELKQFVQRYVVCEDHTATTATLWIAFTWFIDVVTIAPIANITAPLPNCGKSTLLDLMEQLTRKPIKVDNVSPAALFRTIEKWGPTLLIDEVDSFLNGNEDARGILNSGHKRNGKVLRLVGNNHEPYSFSTWGAKALCGIGSIATTLESRSIRLELRRKLPGETVENLRHASSEEIEQLTRQLARLANDTGSTVQAARPPPIQSLNNRAQDNWEPLLAIADTVGGKWPAEALRAALVITGADSTSDIPDANTELLRDIQQVFGAASDDKLFTTDLLEGLCGLDEALWNVWNRGKPITARQLSKRLKGFGIKPCDIRIGGAVRKGYSLSKFSDAFKRYLPCTHTSKIDATPLQTATGGGFEQT